MGTLGASYTGTPAMTPPRAAASCTASMPKSRTITPARICMWMLFSVMVSVQSAPQSIPARQANDACSNDIAAAIASIALAAANIANAVDDCASNATSACVADVASAASQLTSAAADVSQSLNDCYNCSSSCATDLLSLTHSLAQTASLVASATKDCDPTQGSYKGCAADVLGSLVQIADVVGDAFNAASDCASLRLPPLRLKLTSEASHALPEFQRLLLTTDPRGISHDADGPRRARAVRAVASGVRTQC